ncbi:MAG TPA: PrsW family glutamic-type intramembrane protease [Polyangiaceae bacterium]|nr:PrsW family glutamic-type intramembrane protease [Polyangiaceae bacterium]
MNFGRGAPPTLPRLLALLAVLSVALGFGVDRWARETKGPLDRAREFANEGYYGRAEAEYLVLARQRPASVPVLVELLDNHEALRVSLGPALGMGAAPEDAPIGSVGRGGDASGADESPIDAVLSAPDLPPDVALLGRWWREVDALDVQDADAALVIALAAADPPAPWANHLLGREAERHHKFETAAERYAREAGAFGDRREDAERASAIWIEAGHWDRLAEALGSPTFVRQVGADVRHREALHRHDWLAAMRWFFPAQYEGATLGVLALASISGLAWFVICAQVGLVRERWRMRVPLYVAAFVLGVASTYVVLGVAALEQGLLGLREKGNPLQDAIYFVVGVGLREELAKALLLLPLVPIVRTWGRRREALACGALVGLGFAAEENLGYFHTAPSAAFARFLTANFLHVSTTGLVAVAIDDAARGREDRPGDLSRTLMLVIAAHGLYDFFLSSAPVEGSSFLSMLVFIFLTRRFVDVLRTLPGREGPLLYLFGVGLVVVAGASFVYACAWVGPQHAAVALLEGGLGVGIVIFVFIQELANI